MQGGQRQRQTSGQTWTKFGGQRWPRATRDRNRCRKITFGGREGVGGCCSFEEEAALGSGAGKTQLKGRHLQGKEDKDFGPDAGVVVNGVDTERLKGAQNNEDGGPPVIQRERKVDEDLISVGLRRVMLLHDVIDVLFIERVRPRRSRPCMSKLTVTAELTNRANTKAAEGGVRAATRGRRPGTVTYRQCDGGRPRR